MQKQLNAPSFFPVHPTIKVEAEELICHCGKKLKVLKTQVREKLVTLQIGQFTLHETVKHCPGCQKVFKYEGVKRLVPEFCNFGFDVIEYVGRALFLKHCTVKEIIGTLREKNVHVCDREVSFLGKKFITYLVQAHKSKPSEIKKFLQAQGGYILHFDATCDGDSPHLLCAIAEEVDLVLGSEKVPSESTEAIASFLTNIKEQYGTPLAGVCDMLKANLAGFVTVFPGIKLFVCHFHFLRDIGKDLMEYDYSMLRDGLKRYGVNTRLKEISKKLQEVFNPDNEKHLNQPTENALLDSFGLSNDFITKVLVEWIRDFKSELNGYGFPFDQKYLVQFQRMREAYQFLENIQDVEEPRELKYFLAAVVEDPELKSCVARLEKKEVDFNRLRKAMKIALPEGKEGLNDDGSLNDMLTIEKRVTAFTERDEIKSSTDRCYQKMYKQIKKYWDKLFADPIEITLPNGDKRRVYPQRTNNILERFFRELNRGNRKRSGGKSLGRTLQTMLAETPLVKNLNNPEYLNIILNGETTLAARFAEIDSVLIRKDMEGHQIQEEKYSASFKQFIKNKNLPAEILIAIKRNQNSRVIA